jgi:hypothetical protein
LILNVLMENFKFNILNCFVMYVKWINSVKMYVSLI